MRLLLALRLALGICLYLPVVWAAPDAPPHHLFFRIEVGKEISKPVSGRLLLFLEPGKGASSVDTNPFHPEAVYVAAKEIRDVAPGSAVDIDADAIAFPAGFSHLASGDYQAQAVVDVNHSYNYGGREVGDPISPVVALPHLLPASSIERVITLNATVPEAKPPAMPGSPEDQRQEAAHVREETLVSHVLTRFWDRPITMRALIVTPPGYGYASRKYPAVYFTHGFGGNLRYLQVMAARVYARMAQKKIPPMIWIMLDESCPEGTHEFADSANNGPWGRALTTEFIPYLESRYAVDRRASARFLNGHSSGGWATLWLQVTYPRIFGGTWSTSPDPSDFHDFTGIDLYAPHANVYHEPDGSLYPLVRINGKVVSTFEDFARLEAVLGPYGGQMASFEWVFSPKSPGGPPMPMFDRVTGDVDPNVVRAWEKYDISRVIANHWRTLAPNLNGKIHLIVGTEDTFYLDGSAHKLKAVLDSVHANAQVTFLEGRTHMDLYRVGTDPMGLLDEIAGDMYKSWEAGRSPRGPGRIRGSVNHGVDQSRPDNRDK
jgi:enterochelin esterase-like enzyme